MVLPNIPNVWAILAILLLLSGSHGAAYLSGRTAIENKQLEAENKSLLEWAKEQKRIVEGYKPIYEAIAASTDEAPVGSLIAGTLDDIKRVRSGKVASKPTSPIRP